MRKPPMLCGNCAFPQNFDPRKSAETTVFFAVKREHWSEITDFCQFAIP